MSCAEDYYKHRLPSIAGTGFPLNHVVFLLGFSTPCLETTLLVRMCFTCAGPAEVIKASAALCRKGRVWKLDQWESACWCKQFSLQILHSDIGQVMFVLHWWTRRYFRFFCDFYAIKWHPLVKACLQTFFAALKLWEDSHGNPSEQPLKPFYVNGWKWLFRESENVDSNLKGIHL